MPWKNHGFSEEFPVIFQSLSCIIRAPLRTRSQWASAAQACIRRCSRGGAGLSAEIRLVSPLHGRLGHAASPLARAWGFPLSASAVQPCYGVTCAHYRSHPWRMFFVIRSL